jgi:dTMP kinase
MRNNTYPGKFIVLEGLDGSGQSTQVALLKELLLSQGREVVSTKEPTVNGSSVSQQIRDILDKKVKADPAQLQELFAQDRREHLDNLIIPALKEGKFVISDRYFFSSFAYGSSDGLDLEWLMKINDEFLIPDATFLLKVSPAVCVDRIQKRGKEVTLFEVEDKLKKVWENYSLLPSRLPNVYIVNGEKTIEEVFAEINKLVLLKLKL